jgi:hypothetical protein
VACSSGTHSKVSTTAELGTGQEALKTDDSLRMLSATENVQPKLTGFEPALENQMLRLYINRQTAEIAVYNKHSSQVWYSNPQDRDKDTKATPFLIGKLGAQVSLKYLTMSGQDKDYDSFNDSIKYKQFDIALSKEGVTVTFRFGNSEKGLESLPEKVSDKRFQEYLSKLVDKSDIEELNVRRYVLNSNIGVWERRQQIANAIVPKLIKIFEKIGYTEKDLAIDNQENGVQVNETGANAKFTVPINYSLNEDHLVAFVDTTKIIEETPQFRIHSISILENFGAAGLKDDGYIFLPDGSGMIMNLNNGRNLASPIILSLYGDDASLSVDEKFNTYQPTRLPVFGLKKGDAAFFGIIEKGAALTKLTADTSGRTTNYNEVSSQFTILPKGEVRLSDSESMFKTPSRRYMGKLQIRYSFLSGDQADYSGMAATYRSYLEQTYGMKKIEAIGDAPFYLELTGSIPKMSNFLGFPYETLVPLSDLKSTSKLIDQLHASQVHNIRLDFKGWFNKGINHEYPASIKMDSVIGNKTEWQNLGKKLSETGGALYPDAAFQEVYKDANGFKARRDSAQYISRQYSRVFEYDRAAFFKEFLDYYALSPSKLSKSVDGFLSDYGQYNPGGISLRDLGSDLNSDFKKSLEVTREDAHSIVVNQLEKIKKAVPDIMISGGNAYALPYASHIINIPDRSNEYQLAGQSVPFYQMVLHGYVEYAGKPFNLADEQDGRVNILHSLETSSNVYYSWILNDPSVLKNTRFDRMYSNSYKVWYEEAVQAYVEVNKVLKRVRGQAITHHAQMADKVYKTEYENGVTVIVNYGEKSAIVDGITVQANDYSVSGGETNGK